MKQSKIDMILPSFCNYFDNNLKSATLPVKFVSMNACYLLSFLKIGIFVSYCVDLS